MAKALKQMLASQLEADLDTSPNGMMLIDPGAMTMEANEAFRKDLREKAGGARMRVIHNRTATVAIKARGWDGDVDALTATLTGPSAVVYGGDGPIPIAKVVRDWSKKQKDLKVKGAVADGEVLVDADAQALADMPDLEQLKGMLAGAIIGAARGIAGSLQAVYGGLARAIQARVDESPAEEGGAEAAE
ncbi:MAG: 50S ribosomal protein L10 [Planctomycetota bacterium]|nr:50S ribosomal protein L10 [Planctomycetota bacterium]